MAYPRNIFAKLLLCAVAGYAQESPKTIVAISATGGDYIKGAGGTLARFIAEGFQVYVIQVGNDEKASLNLGPAETRLANNADALRAAKALGVTEVINLNNKSGELSQLSSNELRNQLSTLIRFFKPQKLFLPDPFIHYDPDWDQFWTARAAEETNYSNSAVFLAELARIGIKGHGVPETYYYSARRPYRPGEGGHNGARLEAIDISPTLSRKLAAAAELKTTNRAYAEHVRQRLEQAGKSGAGVDETVVTELLTELAQLIGAKHQFSAGEEFNYHGAPPGTKQPIAPWLQERAKPLPK
jgi:LmbE family N-acetylglucosaminyl deacetylase